MSSSAYPTEILKVVNPDFSYGHGSTFVNADPKEVINGNIFFDNIFFNLFNLQLTVIVNTLGYKPFSKY